MTRDLATDDPQILLDRIRHDFPGLTWSNFEFMTHSWEYQVIILDDKYVFRFPNSSALLPSLKREILLLEKITMPSHIQIPRYAMIAKDKSFVGYPIVTGSALTLKGFDGLAPTQQDDLAGKVADFLRTLHSTPLESVKALAEDQTTELVREDEELQHKLELLIKPRLSPEHYAKAQQTLTACIKQRQSHHDRKLIHGDFYGRHMLWEPTQATLGVIDFSDCGLGDPAMDFAELFEFGVDFAQKVAENYGLENPSTILKRALLYYQRVGVFLMINSLEDTKIDFQEAYGLFQKAHAVRL